ncbi:MAG TPA: FHA domain-containing protein [Labilithrix sp.]|jgi:hypothetical protein|nr:FHA domain-containing protein [Labilithrix sp.]
MFRTAIVTRPDEHDTTEIPVESGASSAPSFTLRIVAGSDVGTALVLEPSASSPAVLGHATSCAIQLRDRHVSRRHISLTATPTHVLLVDLGSTNGTRVNDVFVREARLFGGERIELGRTILVLENNEMSVSSERAIAPRPADHVAAVLAEQLPFPDARQRVVADFERRYVEELLARHEGNVTKAARASGIAHRYFQLVRARSR